MEMMYLVLCVLCVGVVMFTACKNSKLIRETDSAKREYLNAKSNNIKLESCINETREMNKKLMNDMDSLQRMYSDCKSEMRELRFTVQSQSGLILELQDRISDLEYDNVGLKQKLKIHDEVAKRSKVVVPFKATI